MNFEKNTFTDGEPVLFATNLIPVNKTPKPKPKYCKQNIGIPQLKKTKKRRNEKKGIN